jgi:hypothetical protein
MITMELLNRQGVPDDLRSPVASRRRPTKFTAERIQQIKDLVARGVEREEIAALMGATLGSLQVTCSRLGISLARDQPAKTESAERVEAAATEGEAPEAEQHRNLQCLRELQRQGTSR